jgi:3-hydroxyisobutyrate dehydrogenase-like beta-hydroxyacid dehydrogenase
MLKDLDVAIKEAAKFGVRLPMIETLMAHSRSAVGLEYPLGEPL